jgi:hypothetical protein
VKPTGRNYEHFGKQTYRSLDISSHINVGGYMFFEKALAWGLTGLGKSTTV